MFVISKSTWEKRETKRSLTYSMSQFPPKRNRWNGQWPPMLKSRFKMTKSERRAQLSRPRWLIGRTIMCSSSWRWSRVICRTTRGSSTTSTRKFRSSMEIISALRAQINRCNLKCKKCKILSRNSKIKRETSRICSKITWPKWKIKSENRMNLLNKTSLSYHSLKNNWKSSTIRQKL